MSSACIICGSIEIDDAIYGPKLIMLVKNQKQFVHHHCMVRYINDELPLKPKK